MREHVQVLVEAHDEVLLDELFNVLFLVA